MPVNPPKNRVSSELLYKSNKPQVFYGLYADKPLGMLVEHSKNSNSNSSRVLPTSRVVYQLLYNNQINARALIDQSAVGYCAGKPTEKPRVF